MANKRTKPKTKEVDDWRLYSKIDEEGNFPLLKEEQNKKAVKKHKESIDEMLNAKSMAINEIIVEDEDY